MYWTVTNNTADDFKLVGIVIQQRPTICVLCTHIHLSIHAISNVRNIAEALINSNAFLKI